MPDLYTNRVPKAQLSVHFIIIGASIAGLASAYALRQAGHRVTVFEQTDGKYRSRGGIRSPPNMTRILDDWGLGHMLVKMGVKASGFTFKVGETGETIGVLKLHDQLMKALRADFHFVLHGDVHTAFYDLASNAGVNFKFDSRVTKVDPWTGTVYIANGSKYTGDVVIGADGYKSLLRPLILGPAAAEGFPDKRITLNFTVSTDAMREHDDLVALCDAPEWTIWMANGASFYGFPVRSKREYGMVITLPAMDDPFDEHWNDHFPMDNLKLNLSLFEPRVRKLVTMARTVTPTKYMVREPFESWVHDSGKVVLAGDAAHPLMPNGTHNAAMAIEDAATLGGLFAHLRTYDQIPIFLCAYEEIRQPRCAAAQQSERQKRDFIALPHGSEQRARDDGLREAMANALLDWDDADEEYLRDTWEEYLEQFGYDAKEKVEDWWTKWGPMMERGIIPDSVVARHPLKYEVVVSRDRGAGV